MHTQVTATDGDRDRESDIVYFLTGQGVDNSDSENNKFVINQTTGEIYVLKPLDRDLPQGRSQWRFTVFAEDEGGNGLVGFADVLVNLKGMHPHDPLARRGETQPNARTHAHPQIAQFPRRPTTSSVVEHKSANTWRALHNLLKIGFLDKKKKKHRSAPVLSSHVKSRNLIV